MKTAFFYLLPMEELQANFQERQEQIVCSFVCEQWRQGKRILVNCEDESQAERLDELMWQLPTDAFIPHNLAGEGGRYGAPVELCWPEKRGQTRRQLAINLQPLAAPYLTSFMTIIDFVPAQEQLKDLARERYKIYRAWGFSLKTSDVPSAHLIQRL